MNLGIKLILGSGLCIITCLTLGMRSQFAATPAQGHAAPVLRQTAPSQPFDQATRGSSTMAQPDASSLDDEAGSFVEAQAATTEPSAARTKSEFDLFFQNENGDSAWSANATNQLSRAVQAVLPAGSRIRRLECKTTMCRIEASHSDLAEFSSYVKGAFHERETRVTTNGVFATLTTDSPPSNLMVSVAFLAREGTELPSLETNR